MDIESLALFCAMLAPVLLAWLWGRVAKSRVARVWLRRSAWVCGGMITGIFLGGLAITRSCAGNWLYGYRSCGSLGETFANAAFMALTLLFLAVAAYGIVLFVVCAVIEWRAARASDRP